MIAIANANGSIIGTYTYDAWGYIYAMHGTSSMPVYDDSDEIVAINPIRYRGYYYDKETGLYYLQSRYYDSETGRFINADKFIITSQGINGYNLFTYCNNNPVNMSDASGYWPQWLINTVKVVNAVINAIKKTNAANAKKSSVSSSINQTSNIPKARSLPKLGRPGSSQTLPNPDGTPKQKRWYGPDGNAERDRDYNHPGNMPFPHDHEWKDGVRQPDHLPPDTSYEFSFEPVLGAGLVVVCAIGIGVIVVDDLTGVGIADDFLLGPLGAGASQGLFMIFG